MSSVDVILPVRGHCRWLEQALDSIHVQTRKPEYITLVDDGLSGAERVGEYGRMLFGSRFRIIPNKGAGLSDALNTGVRNSNCDWIARMDADDIAYPQRLEVQLGFLSSNGNQSLAGCAAQAEFINEEGKSLGVSANPLSWDEIQSLIVRRSCFVHPTLIMRRKILLEVPYRRVFDGAEDIDLVLRISEKGKILNSPSVLLKYRMHYDQSSFVNRPRQTALQELAIRLYYIRKSGMQDPVESNSGLVEQFVSWRLSRPGYCKTRMLLTMLRYMALYLGGRDYNTVWHLLKRSATSIELSASVFTVIYRVIKNSGAAFVNEQSPFPELNIV